MAFWYLQKISKLYFFETQNQNTFSNISLSILYANLNIQPLSHQQIPVISSLVLQQSNYLYIKYQMSMRSPIKRPLRTQSIKSLLKQKKAHTRYDQSLFLKTSFHLHPKSQSQSKIKSSEKIESTVVLGSQIIQGVRWKKSMSITHNKLPFIPNSVSIFKDPMRMYTQQIPETDNYELLLQHTKVLVSAKRWGIFQNQSKELFKGFKVKKQHEIASLTKIMTFYCAYIVVIKYYLIVEKFELLVDKQAELLRGTKAHLVKDDLVTLMDLFYGLMLNSGNDAAYVITKNLGALIYKKNRGEYFSPYDIKSEPNKGDFQKIFICLMNSAAKQLKMTQTKFYNSHGMIENLSTVKDLATITYECLRIPLFSQIVSTKKHTAKAKFINSLGQIQIRNINFVNTNKLLANPFYKGIKTGTSHISGGCLISLYEEPPQINILVVVLGSSGQDSRFNDTEKLVEWYKTRKQRHCKTLT